MEPSTSDPGTSTLVTLQPFIHQVGGHSSIQQFDQYTVCKPLFSKELRFYEEVCPAFEPFIPKFKGVLTVKYFNELGTSTCQVVSTHGDIRLHNYRYGKHCNTCSCQKESHHSREVQQKDAIEYYYSDEESTRFTMNNDDPSFNDSSLEYILLENVVGHCKYPCILDLKMGTEKHKDYMVSKEEADRRQARWDQTTSRSLGVRICGMKVYHVNKSDFLVKKGGRHLTIKGFKDAIKTFLYNGKRFRLDVIEPYLKQLGELLTVMESQSSYRFYNSSLLLIYEGEDYSKIDKSTGHCLNDEDPSMPVSSGAQNSRANVGVRMIDFAHVHYNNQTANSELLHVADEGYLFGLRSVIRILKETLVELQNNEPSDCGKRESCWCCVN